MNSINKVLITGGSGFVGHAMQAVQPAGIDAAYLNRDKYYGGVWRRESWDAIVHLAPVSPSYVLQSAPRVLYASSGAVNQRNDVYSNRKKRDEQICGNYDINTDVDVVIARLFCFVGPYLPLDKFSIGQFIQDGLNGGPIRFYDIGCVRSYLYSEDLGRWMWKILLEGNGIYDVGSQWPLHMRNVAETIAMILGCKAVESLPIESDKPKVYMPNVMRAKDLGCEETVHFVDAVERTIAWNRERIANG